LDLSAVLQESLPHLAGRSVTLGIRAEDLQPVGAGQAWISGELEMVEDLGSDRFFHLKCGRADLVARADREAPFRPGDTISLNVSPGGMHLFQDGKRLDI
jgi:sn-glycerol 3-phosphate transport system ATP-binding protein